MLSFKVYSYIRRVSKQFNPVVSFGSDSIEMDIKEVLEKYLVV